MLPKHWTRWQGAIIIASVIYAVVFITVISLHPSGPLFDQLFFHHHPLAKGEADGAFYTRAAKIYKAFQNTYQIFPPLFASICALLYVKRGQHSTRARRVGWLLIGLGSLSFALGQISWTYYESIKGDVPTPYGWPDMGYLVSYPFLIFGMIFIFGSTHLAGRARLLLDSALAASSVGVMSWYFLVQGLWKQDTPGVDITAKLVSIAYPLSDMVVLFCAFTLFYGTGSDRVLRRSSFFLAFGTVLIAFADSLYSYMNFTNSYQTGSWFDWGWSFGWLLVGYASLLAFWWPQVAVEQVQESFSPQAISLAPSRASLFKMLSLPVASRVFLPYIAAIGAFSYVAKHDFSITKPGGHYLDNTVVMLGVWLIFLVIVRQILTLLENQQLTTILQMFNEQLEQMVHRRTKQLIELHELTKAVNNTLVEDEVLAAAIRHTQQALQADAVTLRLLDGNDGEGETESPDLYPPITLSRGLEGQSQLIEFITALPVKEKMEMVALPVELLEHEPANNHYLRAPLLFQQRMIGMIGVIRWNAAFGNTEPEMLESIGLEVGAAYENARRYRAAVEAADRDSVTGLYNHRAIHQRLEGEFQRATRQNRALSLMMMDLNNFKLFNDTYGHPVGDQVLKTVAIVLQSECRAFDVLGRYGGDEFLVILPDTDEPMAMIVAQRLRDRMSREGFRSSQEENTVPVTLSFGIATYPTDSSNRHELLTIADANLYTAKLSKEGIVGTTDTQRSHRELRTEESFGVLDAMVTAVDNKDRYTRRHSEDVTEYALWIGEELGMSEETMRIIRVGGLLHDVGKIGVPDEILRKPGKLTNEEYEVLKRHPVLGALIVSGVPGMEAIVDAVRSHHERWDGKGYPDNLTGDNIPLIGRIMAVADAFSAMTTTRAYRKGLDWEAAVAEIRKNVGTQFDPKMAKAFLAAADKRRPNGRAELKLIGGNDEISEAIGAVSQNVANGKPHQTNASNQMAKVN